MSAERLREAAALMRSRAEASSAGPWRSWVEGRDGFGGDDVILTTNTDMCLVHATGVPFDERAATQDHIASWHPLVALAVADWLDQEADVDALARHYGGRGLTEESHAVIVADAYLGAP